MTPRALRSRTSRRSAGVVLTALAVILPAGCSSDSSSSSASHDQVCSQLDDLVSSTRNFKNVTISENGLAEVSGQLQQMQTALDQLATEVSSSAKPKVATVQSQVQQLQQSIAAVRTQPTNQNIGAARTALITLQATIAALPSEVQAAC
jgi:gas vesicle protein